MKKQADLSAICYTMIRRARTVTAVTLLAFAAIFTACSGSEPTGPNGEKVYKNPAGSYNISTVNDKALPVAIFSGHRVHLRAHERHDHPVVRREIQRR